MRNTRLSVRCLALFIVAGLWSPRLAMAQSPQASSAYTGHALTIGFLVLAVIVLVFLGLMLKARVNELQGFSRQDTIQRKPADPSRELMQLDEAEISVLLEQRKESCSGGGRPEPAGGPGR